MMSNFSTSLQRFLVVREVRCEFLNPKVGILPLSLVLGFVNGGFVNFFGLVNFLGGVNFLPSLVL